MRAASLVKLVDAALEQSHPAGITEILRAIALECDAFGAVLWEAKPGFKLDVAAPQGTLFALANWFEDGLTWQEDNIPLGQSATGKALVNHLTFDNIKDIQAESGRLYQARFIVDNDVRRGLIVPVEFIDQTPGALDVFRRGNAPPFDEREISLLLDFAPMLPKLFQTLRHRLGYFLSREVNRILQSRTSIESDQSTEGFLRDVIGDLVISVQDGLKCLDVSVFLKDPTEPAAEAKLYGTTLNCSDLPGSEIGKIEDTDPAGYALTRRTSVRIFDLVKFDNAEEAIQNEYPGIGPPDRKYVDCVLRTGTEVSAKRPEGARAPASFMAAGIFVGDRSFGVIRCCFPISGPLYFADREIRLLELIAGQIGQFIGDTYSRFAVRRENQTWRNLAENLAKIVNIVQSELRSSEMDIHRILRESLKALHAVMPEASFLGIRSASDVGLVPVSTIGWHRSGAPATVRVPESWEKRPGRIDTRVIVGEELAGPDAADYVSTLPLKPGALLLAPIVAQGPKGLLEVGYGTAKTVPTHAVQVASIVAGQIGLYQTLASTLRQLNQTTTRLTAETEEREKTVTSQRQAMMDLKHQINAPIRQARRRIQVALSTATEGTKLTKQLLYARGILRRASRVSGNIGLFVDLAMDRPIKLKRRTMSHAAIQKAVIEACMDSSLLVHSWREITFSVDEFEGSGTVELDEDLFDQALSNLLDNAGKYSFEKSHVRVTLGQEKDRKRPRFYVAVRNRGIRLTEGDAARAKERGWRSPFADSASAEGQGIGLWIVDHIMRAHEGSLVVNPTGDDGFTEIRLAFPSQ
jgi:signal transduction histidine kinase